MRKITRDRCQYSCIGKIAGRELSTDVEQKVYFFDKTRFYKELINIVTIVSGIAYLR